MRPHYCKQCTKGVRMILRGKAQKLVDIFLTTYRFRKGVAHLIAHCVIMHIFLGLVPNALRSDKDKMNVMVVWMLLKATRWNQNTFIVLHMTTSVVLKNTLQLGDVGWATLEHNILKNQLKSGENNQ